MNQSSGEAHLLFSEGGDCLRKQEPFARILGLAYYDGVTSGVAESATSSACYRLMMLDELPDWDEGNDIRIFSLALLPAGSLDRIVEVCPDREHARWPVWVPSWRFDSESAQQSAEREVQSVLDNAAPPHMVIATDAGLRTIMASRQVTEEDLAKVSDWLAFLGLAGLRSTRHA